MIGVVGGGWFGCHLAACLQSRGIGFELFEQRPRLFEGASGYNQNRLHLGFHYPRSAVTRRETFEFAQTFMREYPDLTADVPENIYAVVSGESLLDWETYRTVMGSGPYWEQRDPASFGLQNVSGCLDCAERVILTGKAREHFTEKLGANLRLGQRFEAERCGDYEHIINCTYQTWQPSGEPLVYEPCVTLIYEPQEKNLSDRAITLMDGPFFSIYPFQDGLVTLYGVKWSRLGRVFTAADAAILLDDYRKSCDRDGYLKAKMEHGISKWLPSFRDQYKYVGWHGAVRAISTDASDARTCKVVQCGNVIHVLSGKIDSIFHAEREVLRCLGLS